MWGDVENGMLALEGTVFHPLKPIWAICFMPEQLVLVKGVWRFLVIGPQQIKWSRNVCLCLGYAGGRADGKTERYDIRFIWFPNQHLVVGDISFLPLHIHSVTFLLVRCQSESF